MSVNPGNVLDLSSSVRSLKPLFTKLRDVKTSNVQFRTYANRIMTIISEEGLSQVSPIPKTISTPTGSLWEGVEVDYSSIVVVSIIRAGDSMLDVFLQIAPEVTVGKILIQRDEATAQPVLFYGKLPSLLNKNIILLDPMLATGGSAICALKVLIENGAEESRIYFFNVVSCPEGIAAMQAAHPAVTIVTGAIDAGLNEKVSDDSPMQNVNIIFFITHLLPSLSPLRRNTSFLALETTEIDFTGQMVRLYDCSIYFEIYCIFLTKKIKKNRSAQRSCDVFRLKTIKVVFKVVCV